MVGYWSVTQAISHPPTELNFFLETTIAVSWCGGGQIKEKDKVWSMAEVITAANEFPNQVAIYSQRISAILMDYRSLRSFHVANYRPGAKPYEIPD